MKTEPLTSPGMPLGQAPCELINAQELLTVAQYRLSQLQYEIMAAPMAIALVYLALFHPAYGQVLLIVMAMISVVKELIGALSQTLFHAKVRWRKQARFVLTLILPILVFFVFHSPAQAVFLSSAERYMTQTLTTLLAAGDSSSANITQGVTLTFAALRILFIIYIAVSLIQVIQSARNNDDWQTTARTPVIVALVVVIGDLLTNLIIPPATTV